MRARIALSAACMLTVPVALFAQEESSGTLTVGATAHVEREPDQATITFAVETMEETVTEATEQNATRMEALFEALRGLGLHEERMRTASYQTRPNYGRGNEPRLIGHYVTNSVEVRLDSIEEVGETIDVAIRAGANRVAGMVFSLSDPDEARHAALGQAVDKARGEAEVLAGAIGESLGSVIDIRNEAARSPRVPPPARISLEAASGQSAATPIEPGLVRVDAAVTVVYRLERP